VPDDQRQTPVPRPAQNGAIDAFLEAARRSVVPATGRGRLVFALDATMSRQPTWDLAQRLQGEMFATTAKQGGLDVQLVYFRGFGECRASRFTPSGEGLAALMSQIDCRGGRTQIAKVLRHVRDETKTTRVGALVYIGDAMEEKIDDLCAVAGELGLLGVKAFMFQEGATPGVATAYKEIARLTGGAHVAFDARAPQKLAELLGAAAAYAVGGMAELERRASEGQEAARLLLARIG